MTKKPEVIRENFQKFISRNRNIVISDIPSDDNWNYNCWGFTAYCFGWEKETKWLEHDVMEGFLKNHTYSITKEKSKPGDILVFRGHGNKGNDGTLYHTAILIDKNIVIHKPGQQNLEVSEVREIFKYHPSYGKNMSYRRINSKNT